MPEHPVLVVRNLTLALNGGKAGVRIVKDVGFCIGYRRVLGLVGESGSGKSLTCLSIMGLLPLSVQLMSGEILFEDRPLSKLEPAAHRALRGKSMAMVLQNPMSCFDAVFTIRHHFRTTLAAHEQVRGRAADRAACEALREVGFEEPNRILDGYPFQMSGGMLQRVMVALAVMMKAALLIADEPTTDLDVVSQARILDLLARLRTEHGMAILLVTHDLSVIASLADDVVVMKAGSIVEAGSVAHIFNHATHPYTRALLAAHADLHCPALDKLLSPEATRTMEDKASAG